jgi:hypothetical protein
VLFVCKYTRSLFVVPIFRGQTAHRVFVLRRGHLFSDAALSFAADSKSPGKWRRGSLRRIHSGVGSGSTPGRYRQGSRDGRACVLPEYAVDLYFASMAAKNPSYAQYAAANMTGSNRLLIGVGWSVVALCSVYAAFRNRDPSAKKEPMAGVSLGGGYSVDCGVGGGDLVVVDDASF